MKKAFIFFSLVLCSMVCFSQQKDTTAKINIYNPQENAEEELAKAVKQAKASGKHVFVQIGGNWCIWCMRFNQFVTGDAQLDSLVNANYVIYHLNYSKENKNLAVMEKLGFPQRFGFPVFVILDGKGNRLNTINSSGLEQGKSYHRDEVWRMFENWSPAALNPKNYK